MTILGFCQVTQKKKKTGKSPDSPGEDTLLLYDGEPNKKEAFHLCFFFRV